MNQLIRIVTILFLTISAAQAQDFVFSPINVMHGLSDNQVRYTIQLPDGRMVFKTSGNINIYDGAHFKYIHQNPQHIYPLSTYSGHYRIYQGKKSLLWIKDQYKLMCLDLQQEKYQSNLDTYFKKIGFKKPIEDLFVDSEQRLWLLTAGKLSLADGSKSLELSTNLGVLQDLASAKDYIYLFYNNGAVVCYNQKTNSKVFSLAAYPPSQHHLFNNTSLVVKGKNGFYQLRNGSMGGFFFFDIHNQTWKKILETPYTLNTLVIDNYGKAAISCTNGIWLIDTESAKKDYLPTLKKKDGNLLNSEISTIFYDKQDGLWLGTLNQGLLYNHPSKYMFKNIGRKYFPNLLAKDIIVESFAEDLLGNIYLKCQSTIYKYNNASPDISLQIVTSPSLSKQVVQQLNHNYSSVNGNHSTLQFTDKNGIKWIGTADGLKVIDPKTGKENIYYTEDGLSNNFIHGIFEDREKNIWITTSYGINKAQLDPKSRKIIFTKYGSDAGTLEGEYADGAIFQSKNGTIYFGGINGFSILEPNKTVPKKLPFQPVFTNLFLKGEKIQLGNSYNGRIILPISTAFTDHITLSYDQNFVTFEFSALNYLNPTQTYYRYQLQGIDQYWKESANNITNGHVRNDGMLAAAYTNLPAGSYKLRVMASNNNTAWDGPITELSITIHPPWWKTTLALILFATIFLMMVLATINIYMRNAKKKLELKHREAILLLRIRNLIDQQNSLHTEKINIQPAVDQDNKIIGNNQADTAFLSKALAQVEKNLNDPNYSVEQLSSELNMDRTGLYRKLVTLLDKSPSLFIRNVRLEKAANLILEGELNISEIADKVGFSSSSYLSKCFQERYGCRPSEYAQKIKKST